MTWCCGLILTAALLPVVAATYGGMIFQTEGSFAISNVTGGLVGADKLCQTEGSAKWPGTEWAAFLVDERGCKALDDAIIPCRRASALPGRGDGQIDWVLAPNADYYRIDNTTFVGSTDDKALLVFPLNNSIPVGHCVNQGTGLSEDWTAATNATCGDWKNYSHAHARRVGWSCSTSTHLLNGGGGNCDTSGSILCVSPPAKRASTPTCGKHGECQPGTKCASPTTGDVDCSCRCGCEYKESSQLTQNGYAIAGATIVDAPTEPVSNTTATMCGVPVSLGSLYPRGVTPATRAVMPSPFLPDNANGTCQCRSLHPGVPACNDQYPVPFQTNLTSLHHSLHTTDRIAFFGDSITWLGGYIGLIRAQLDSTEEFQNVTLFNRGINGGKIIDIRDGLDKCAGFDEALQEDQPTLVNIMIGINDVWFAGGPRSSNVTAFANILTDLVARATKFGAEVAISTVSVIGEHIDGNYKDELLTNFTDAARSVASQTGVGLSDVHGAYWHYLNMYNVLPRGKGIARGVLTIDGVHPCMGGKNNCPNVTHGNQLLADTIASGIIDARTRTNR